MIDLLLFALMCFVALIVLLVILAFVMAYWYWILAVLALLGWYVYATRKP